MSPLNTRLPVLSVSKTELAVIDMVNFARSMAVYRGKQSEVKKGMAMDAVNGGTGGR